MLLNSIFHLSSPYSFPLTLTLLLDAGVDINERDKLRYTPLLAANGYWFGAVECVKVLVARGADVMDDLPLHRCECGWGNRKPEIVQLLLQAGADPNLLDLSRRYDGP